MDELRRPLRLGTQILNAFYRPQESLECDFLRNRAFVRHEDSYLKHSPATGV
jgi:hypothetical protein